MGDAFVVFDVRSWQTHILPPQTAVIAEIALELEANGARVTARSLQLALQIELQADVDELDLQSLLRQLVEIGLVSE